MYEMSEIMLKEFNIRIYFWQSMATMPQTCHQGKDKKSLETVFQELPDKYFDKVIAHSKIGNKSYIQTEQAFSDGQGFKNLRELWTACPDSQFENSPIRDSYGPLEK